MSRNGQLLRQGHFRIRHHHVRGTLSQANNNAMINVEKMEPLKQGAGGVNDLHNSRFVRKVMLCHVCMQVATDFPGGVLGGTTCHASIGGNGRIVPSGKQFLATDGPTPV